MNPESTITLREVVEADLPTFFEQQCDPEANWMAAFTAKDPTNRDAFFAHWKRIQTAESVVVRTIVVEGTVAGHVMSYVADGRIEVTYWIGKEFWGQRIATRALAEFLDTVNGSRPIHARAAKDHTASLRVLEKCGFTQIGAARGFANARGQEIDEWLLERRR